MEDGQKLTLEDVDRILLAARIDIACDHWHLDERALPSLKEHAGATGEPRLAKVVEHTTNAAELLETARFALLTAQRHLSSNLQRTER